MDILEEMFRRQRLESVLERILRNRFPQPQQSPVPDPLQGMDRTKLPEQIQPLAEPWKVGRSGNQFSLSLPTYPKGSQFEAYADVDWPPKLVGGGIRYRHNY